MPRALGRAPTSPLHQSALLWQGLLWRSLGRSLRVNAMRVRLSLRLGLEVLELKKKWAILIFLAKGVTQSPCSV